ncbi:hypothetical protein [Candidatus Coxiella mudrowiae]|uniref:hypothetical protein n=1 Tax=Candidatus Coxiella mudrowiae TaxID=2054173 RepID=UPI001F2F5A4A|nr:hypothetical protein [Candidatus Coxiella mudrowiae]
MLEGGGLALILAADYDWHLTYICMALLMLAQIIPTLTLPPLKNRLRRQKNFKAL